MTEINKFTLICLILEVKFGNNPLMRLKFCFNNFKPKPTKF